MLNPQNYYFELQREWRLTDTPVNNSIGRSEGIELLIQKYPSYNYKCPVGFLISGQDLSEKK